MQFSAADPATELYYSNARWYDAASGRFMTEDDTTGQQEIPLSIDRYIYSDDNPMNLVDLSGNAPVVPPSKAKTNSSPDPISKAVSAVTNWWNGLPPVDRTIIVVAGVAALSVASFGLADVAAGAILGVEVGSDLAGGAAVAEESEAVAEVASSASRTIISKAVGSAITGATINTDVTTGLDLIKGTPISGQQLATSAGLGAFGGSLSIGLTASLGGYGASSALWQYLLGYGGAGGATSLLAGAFWGAGMGTGQGAFDGAYAYYNLDNYGALFDYGFGFLSGL